MSESHQFAGNLTVRNALNLHYTYGIKIISFEDGFLDDDNSVGNTWSFTICYPWILHAKMPFFMMRKKKLFMLKKSSKIKFENNLKCILAVLLYLIYR